MTFKRQIWNGRIFELIGLNLIGSGRGFFCKICKERGGKYAHANDGSMNIKVLALQDYSKIVEHKKLSWIKHDGQKSLH